MLFLSETTMSMPTALSHSMIESLNDKRNELLIFTCC